MKCRIVKHVLVPNPDGYCVIANAGHPAPFLNHQETTAPSTLPLELVPMATFEKTTVHLQPGDHFVLYTDGLLEARTKSSPSLTGPDELVDVVKATFF